MPDTGDHEIAAQLQVGCSFTTPYVRNMFEIKLDVKFKNASLNGVPQW
jgi:hypothetical protein